MLPADVVPVEGAPVEGMPVEVSPVGGSPVEGTPVEGMRGRPVPVLAGTAWRARQAAHADRVDRLTADHTARRARSEKHPVEDFLFTYYTTSVAALRRWHPGPQVALADADELAARRYYRRRDDDTVVVDLDALVARPQDRRRLTGTRALLAATASRPAQLSCFGLHEWAMVYRADATRHPVPLRLGPAGTDAVVEAQSLRCTHFDAFRFFTDAAVPRNAARLSRADQVTTEQPGCLHAGMDLYRAAAGLGPACESELLADCFVLAREIRYLDMAASPYDLTAHDVDPIRIETPAGRAAYVAAQREFAERAAVLRARVLARYDLVLTAAAG